MDELKVHKVENGGRKEGRKEDEETRRRCDRD
jgi:hypothetical protein